ncbi:bifunctional DNA primase/polymerase [Aromatoleum toluclasticum]|uniref:bifunctional DNA primase/polymerase n=1 Tax=Aromatoleum toluclasticum TaxID=92003 RepID=UPI0003625093|nr:bifunctional DNA primase/polymerase [Aromatoleum toluclasticum]
MSTIVCASSMRDAAFAYARRSWPVLPCAPGAKTPLTTHGFRDATMDGGQIDGWWTKWPDANVAILTGEDSGLLVVDVDPRNGGDASLATLEEIHGALPRDYVVESGGGGLHIYLRLPEGIELPCSVLTDGIDVKCEGGYVIAPPSIHPNGTPYRLFAGGAVPPAPDWLVALLQERAAQAHVGTCGAVELPHIDIDELRIPDRTKELIRARTPRGSRSEAIFGVMRSLIGFGYRDFALHTAIFADPRYGISEKVLELEAQSCGAGLRWLRKDFERAQAKPDREDGNIGGKEQKMHHNPTGSRQSGNEQTQRLECVQASAVIPKPVDWLWHQYIPRGKTTLIAGMPGLGKSQLIIYLAAVVTTGGAWPDGTRPPAPANVLIFSAEDDADDTLVPRLLAAGADLDRVHIVKCTIAGCDDSGRLVERLPDMRHDVDALRAKVDEIGNVAFVVFDPFSVYGGDTNHAKNADVRKLLAPLAALAAEKKFALICLSHFNKGGGEGAPREALTRVLDSIGYTAAARAVYGVFKDADAPLRRLFLPIKNNLGLDTSGFVYHIESVMSGGIETSRVVWDGPCETRADDAVNGKVGDDVPDSATLARAVAFLFMQLRHGARNATEIENGAAAAGFSQPTVKRAKKIAGIRSAKCGMHGGWEWELPFDDSHKNNASYKSESNDPLRNTTTIKPSNHAGFAEGDQRSTRTGMNDPLRGSPSDTRNGEGDQWNPLDCDGSGPKTRAVAEGDQIAEGDQRVCEGTELAATPPLSTPTHAPLPVRSRDAWKGMP